MGANENIHRIVQGLPHLSVTSERVDVILTDGQFRDPVTLSYAHTVCRCVCK